MKRGYPCHLTLAGSWMPLGVAVGCVASLAVTFKRFPVPQDNFVPVAISLNCLVSGKTRIESTVSRLRFGDPCSEPLISGSGAIMPLPIAFVKLFVVLFSYYYILFDERPFGHDSYGEYA